MAGQDVELVVHEQPGGAELAPYERLLDDAMAGDATLFARQDAVEAAWQVVDRVLDNDTAPHIYRPGTWGPEQAAALMAHHGGWHDPTGPPVE